MDTEQAQTARWKTPDEMCECIKWMAQNELMRYGDTLDTTTGQEGVMPIIDPHRRRRNAPYAPIKYCPNCGQPTFTLLLSTPTPEASR